MTRPIRLRVRSPEGSVVYEMPYSTKPVPMIPVVTADMLQGATLCVDGYDPTPGAVFVEAYVPPLPKPEPKRR